jgi:hypothetical protein
MKRTRSKKSRDTVPLIMAVNALKHRARRKIKNLKNTEIILRKHTGAMPVSGGNALSHIAI